MLKTIIIHERDMIFLVIMHTHSVKEIIKKFEQSLPNAMHFPNCLAGYENHVIYDGSHRPLRFQAN